MNDKKITHYTYYIFSTYPQTSRFKKEYYPHFALLIIQMDNTDHSLNNAVKRVQNYLKYNFLTYEVKMRLSGATLPSNTTTDNVLKYLLENQFYSKFKGANFRFLFQNDVTLDVTRE